MGLAFVCSPAFRRNCRYRSRGFPAKAGTTNEYHRAQRARGSGNSASGIPVSKISIFTFTFFACIKMNILLAQNLSRVPLRLLLPMFLILSLSVPTIGCAGTSGNDTVRPDVAKETLIAALTAWMGGELPEHLQTRSPAIVVQDMDWSAGHKLLDFELLGDGKSVGANLSIEVQLTLVDTEDKKNEQKVWYLVGTDPALTVFRDMLH